MAHQSNTLTNIIPATFGEQPVRRMIRPTFTESMTTKNIEQMNGFQLLKNACVAIDCTLNDLKNKVDNISATLIDSHITKHGYIMCGDINVDYNKIINVSKPIDIYDVSNKEYVDNMCIKTTSSIYSALSDIYVTKSNPTVNNNLNMTNHRVTDIADPICDSDVCSKKYVDDLINVTRSHIVNIHQEHYLPLCGGKINGDLIISGSLSLHCATQPLYSNDVTTKKYVDDTINNIIICEQVITKNLLCDMKNTLDKQYMPISNNNFCTLNMNNTKIINMALPTDPTDGANKYYVDSQLSTIYPVICTDVQRKIEYIYAPLFNCSFKTAVSMGNFNIINLASPIDNKDAANKKYVDDKCNKITIDIMDNIKNPVVGQFIFDKNLNKICIYNGTLWQIVN